MEKQLAVVIAQLSLLNCAVQTLIRCAHFDDLEQARALFLLFSEQQYTALLASTVDEATLQFFQETKDALDAQFRDRLKPK